jgi:plastocyanin
MRTILSSLLLLVLIACAGTTLQARTVSVQVGGTTTTGDPYYGYNTYPVLMFNPANTTINVGDTVIFSSLGGAPHNVHADDNSFRCANGCDGDGQGGNGAVSADTWTASVTFTKPGVVNFHCDTHQMQGMTGSITVNGTAASGIALGGYLSGNWYNSNQGGHGFQLEFTNTHEMIAIWFVYTPDGSGQSWIYSQGFWDATKNTVTLPAIILTGAKFPPNFVEADVHRQQAQGWGTITFTFSDCNHGTVSWHSDAPGYNAANDTPLPLTRLTAVAGTTCPQ